MAFIITLLVGQAREWGTAMWDNEQDCCSSFDSFSEKLRKVFDRSARGTEAARALALLRQRESSAQHLGFSRGGADAGRESTVDCQGAALSPR